VEGYARFLADCKHALGDQPQQDRHEGPTYEIDLVWYKLCVDRQLMDRLGLIVTDVCRVAPRHAHMMHPVVYGRDCQVLGIDLNHFPWPTNEQQC
jgi:hypothetical protein